MYFKFKKEQNQNQNFDCQISISQFTPKIRSLQPTYLSEIEQ